MKGTAFDGHLVAAPPLIAERTESGIASFNAQEKSTIRIEIAFVTFL